MLRQWDREVQGHLFEREVGFEQKRDLVREILKASAVLQDAALTLNALLSKSSCLGV